MNEKAEESCLFKWRFNIQRGKDFYESGIDVKHTLVKNKSKKDKPVLIRAFYQLSLDNQDMD